MTIFSLASDDTDLVSGDTDLAPAEIKVSDTADSVDVSGAPAEVDVVEPIELVDVPDPVDVLDPIAVSEPVEATQEPEPEAAPELEGFAALGLRAELLSTLEGLGYRAPTPIQEKTIPPMLEGRDLLGQAATGTGKTAAFALPALHTIGPRATATPRVLVLVPTRELAVQVSEAVAVYGRGLGIKVVAVYGGQPIGRQLHALHRGVHVVVATPGRAIDHIRRGSLPLKGIQTVVLDEADEMLDMGFTEDIETILRETPSERQTVMFSATLPSRINHIAKRHQSDPIRIRIESSEAAATKALIHQSIYVVKRQHKVGALGHILDFEAPRSALVFCRTRQDVDDLTVAMNNRGYRAEALHGGMDQQQRDRVMGRLRDGTAELLVATDVAARGLDVDTLSHVVNYDVPTSPESYVHRIGRVGRAGRAGVAITLAEPKDRNLVGNIERLTKQSLKVQKVPTIADLAERRMEATVTRLREVLDAGDLRDYKPVLDALAGEFSDHDIALAALKLADLASGQVTDGPDIPDASFGSRHKRDGKKGKGYERGGRNGARGEGSGFKGNGKPRRRRENDGDTGFVYVGLGRKGGIRPGDLVGAIAGETGLSGSEIGPIRISDHFSVVGVPESSVDTVISAVKGSTIKGKKAKARRFVED